MNNFCLVICIKNLKVDFQIFDLDSKSWPEKSAHECRFDQFENILERLKQTEASKGSSATSQAEALRHIAIYSDRDDLYSQSVAILGRFFPNAGLYRTINLKWVPELRDDFDTLKVLSIANVNREQNGKSLEELPSFPFPREGFLIARQDGEKLIVEAWGADTSAKYKIEISIGNNLAKTKRIVKCYAYELNTDHPQNTLTVTYNEKCMFAAEGVFFGKWEKENGHCSNFVPPFELALKSVLQHQGYVDLDQVRKIPIWVHENVPSLAKQFLFEFATVYLKNITMLKILKPPLEGILACYLYVRMQNPEEINKIGNTRAPRRRSSARLRKP